MHLHGLVMILAATSPPVQVDQVGYTPAESKWVAVPHAVSQVRIRSQATGAVVLTVPAVQRRIADPASGDSVYAADFSSLTTPGAYFADVVGLGASVPFRVDPLSYDALFRHLLKGLYYQRCGTAIPAQYGGRWTHASCHDHSTGVASFDWATTGGAPGNYLDTRGGWHDAGDYGKYTDNNSYAVGLLLQAYLDSPSKFVADDVGIPESGNGIPDLLDEARWSLTWMLKMQRPDGSVLHRESIANYAGDYTPDADPVTRYYTDISSDATAVQCAAMALAASAYAGVDPAFAATCHSAAAASWAWLQAHPSRVPAGGFVNKYGHTGATYIDGSEVGRRLWAAAEIFRMNGDANANAYVNAHWGDTKDFNGVWYPDSWGDLSNLAAFTYRVTPGATPAIVNGSWWSIENSLLSSASGWLTRTNTDGYGCSAAADGAYGDYYWGATGVFLRYAWAMVEAYRVSGDATYLAAAREQVHYILGRNPLGKVYVTGLGSRPVLHSHGAWNSAAGYTNISDDLCHPVPYLLVGGPNKADNSSISPWPGRCYEDIADPNYSYKGNYTLNETAVNIQASFIALAGMLGTGAATVGVSDPPPGPAAVAEIRIAAEPNPFAASLRLQALGPEGEPLQRDQGAAGAAFEIFDLRGARVRRLPAGDGAEPAQWDGRDARGRPLPAGIYFARFGPGGPALRLVKVR